jgi:hypothetical protein
MNDDACPECGSDRYRLVSRGRVQVRNCQDCDRNYSPEDEAEHRYAAQELAWREREGK